MHPLLLHRKPLNLDLCVCVCKELRKEFLSVETRPRLTHPVLICKRLTIFTPHPSFYNTLISRKVWQGTRLIGIELVESGFPTCSNIPTRTTCPSHHTCTYGIPSRLARGAAHDMAGVGCIATRDVRTQRHEDEEGKQTRLRRCCVCCCLCWRALPPWPTLPSMASNSACKTPATSTARLYGKECCAVLCCAGEDSSFLYCRSANGTLTCGISQPTSPTSQMPSSTASLRGVPV
jgi:hypothetical protein